MMNFAGSTKYDNVVFTDAQGVVRMSAVKNVHHVDAIARAGAPGRPDRVLFLDFHRTEPDGPAHLTLVVPVLDAHKPGVLLGTLYLDIDPRKYLFPFIQRWPTTSRSAETLLVRRDGDDAQFLNTLRFQDDAPLSLRIPLTRSDVAAVKAVLGQEGIVEGLDYRGTVVIASLRKVPDSPWFLIARMDTTEVLAPVRETLWLTSSLIGALLLAAAAAVGFALRHQRVGHYKERVKAAEALAASMARHRAVTHSASDAIITADAEGRIVGWNPAAERIFGYAEDEILGQMLAVLMPERYRDEHRIGMQRMAGGWAQRMLFKTVELEGLTQAGEEFPMELSLSQWQAAEGVFFTGIVRDISQRRKTEAALRESETIFKHFMEFSPMYVVEPEE